MKGTIINILFLIVTTCVSTSCRKYYTCKCTDTSGNEKKFVYQAAKKDAKPWCDGAAINYSMTCALDGKGRLSP